jgi:hypothetical protein
MVRQDMQGQAIETQIHQFQDQWTKTTGQKYNEIFIFLTRDFS